MRFSTSAFAPACTSPNHCEADPLRLYPDASGGEAAVTRYRVFPGMESVSYTHLTLPTT